MKLQKIQIKNFRSIEDMEVDFTKEQCLFAFGINESGKSNLLKAIAQLDASTSDPALMFNPGKDIRRVEGKSPSQVESKVTYTFMLSLDQVNKQFTKNFMDYPFEKTHNSVEVKFIVSLNSQGTKQVVIEIAELELEIKGICFYLNEGQEILKEFKLNGNVITPGPEYWFRETDIKNKNEQFTAIITPHDTAPLVKRYRDMMMTEAQSRMPKVIYWKYEPKYLISEPIGVESFVADPNTHITFKNLFKLINANTNELIKERIDLAKSNGQMMRTLEKELSKAATKHINDAWPEYKDLRIEVRHDSGNFEVSILDNPEGMPFSMEDRSDGFKRFVSLVLTLTVNRVKGELENTIILLDEPEESLHPGGIKHLRDELIKLGNKNYLIAASHSIFMVDKTNLSRHLIVRKENTVTRSTPVDEYNFFNEDVIFNALGTSVFEIIKPINIVFEGEDDRKVFTMLNTCAKRCSLEHLDFAALGVCNASGATKVETFLRFFTKGQISFIVVFDDDPEGRGAKSKVSAISDMDIEVYSYDVLQHNKTTFSLEDLLPNSIIEDFVSKEWNIAGFQLDPKKGAVEHIKIAFSKNGVDKDEIDILKLRLPSLVQKHLGTINSKQDFEAAFPLFLQFVQEIKKASKILKKEVNAASNIFAD